MRTNAHVGAGIETALAEAVDDEAGVQICAYRHGELIVEGWAGRMGDDDERPVDVSTLFPVFSVSKAVTATAIHLQAERGLVDYDEPLATYWPEYGTRGKAQVTVRHVLTHRAGVPQMPPGVTPERMCDWDWMVAQLADVEPVFAPGTKNTYLSMTFGWLVGEVVRRTDPLGRPFARFVHDEICEPLGMDSFFFGVPAREADRVATLSFPDQPAPPPEGSLVRQAVPPQVGLNPTVFNRPDVRAACVPAVGGVSNARSLARFFAMIANRGELDGARLLSEERVLSFLNPRSDPAEHDETYGRPMPVGQGGFWLAAPGGQKGGRILAHTAAGGTLAWADVDTGLAVAFCHNRMGMGGGGVTLLSAAVHEIAGV
jgi:CubicO group peptidase (beta-lactamase class C family)